LKEHFLQINQFRPWKFWSLSAKLVLAYVASDMWEVNGHVSTINTPIGRRD